MVPFDSPGELFSDDGVGRLEFEKYHGLGNDFVLVDARASGRLMDPADARRLADRHRGLEVSMGNPHFVLEPRPEDEDLLDLARRLGPILERAPRFVNRTNVELVALRRGVLEVVVFERGVGVTQACGTGAGASVVAARR